jgi:HisJ family histidinol phosphate phosphatase
MEFQINHDLHIHTNLSLCCPDKNMTAENVFSFALESNYETICFTDHLWDKDIKGASNWYEEQNIAHISQILPMPVSDKIRVMFGCEIEYGPHGLSLASEHFDLFDFIVIPVNHFHMVSFVRPQDCDTAEKIAEFFTCRLERLICMDLPWKKIGIAHLTAMTIPELGDDIYRMFKLMPEDRLEPVFKFFAEQGAGIELNAGCFGELLNEHQDDILRLYRIAKKAGCKFYCGSDAHSLEDLRGVQNNLNDVANLLNLTDYDRFVP